MAEEEKVTEVRRTTDDDDRNVTREYTHTEHAVGPGVMAKRIIYYIGGILLALMALRFVFALFGAWEGNGFVTFIYDLTDIFVAPFYGIFGEPVRGDSRFESSTLVAMAVYGLVMVALGKLFTLGRRHTHAEV